MKAVTRPTARGSAAGEAIVPSGGAGDRAPPPETKTEITSPGTAGFAREFWEKSSLKTAGEMKLVALAPNTTGAAAASGTWVDASGAPSRSISTGTVAAPANPSGRMAVTWLADTDNNGAGRPLTSKRMPANSVGTLPDGSQSAWLSGPIPDP